MRNRMLVAFVIGTALGVVLMPAQDRRSDPCKHYLDDAKRRVQRSRNSMWVGVDGERVKAVEHIVDYLACVEDHK